MSYGSSFQRNDLVAKDSEEDVLLLCVCAMDCTRFVVRCSSLARQRKYSSDLQYLPGLVGQLALWLVPLHRSKFMWDREADLGEPR
jgi:hypothetical protein